MTRILDQIGQSITDFFTIFRRNYKKITQRTATIFISLAIFIIIIAIFVPFKPYFPEVGLDPSWRYALNEAVAHGKVFGRDIIFTFGPYAAAVTHQFHPATDTAMIILDLLFGLAFGAGIICLGRRGNFWLAIALPCVLAAVTPWGEALFHGLPLIFLLVVARSAGFPRQRALLPITWPVLWSLAALTLSLGLLPIVKGSFAIPSVLLGLFGFILMLKHRARVAAAGLILFMGGLAGGWTTSGQPISALPAYFINLRPIIFGYTQAMAVWNNEGEAIIYSAIAAILVIHCLLNSVKDMGWLGVLVGLGAAITLFLAMKEGFVRHDGKEGFVRPEEHALIAAGTLIVVGFLIAFQASAAVSVALAAISIFGWSAITAHYMPVTPTSLVQAAESKVKDTEEGIAERLDNKLQSAFDASVKRIREAYPLPSLNGTTDIYSYDQSLLLANGLSWSPRPIFQSYSAYNTELATINADHLNGSNAPQFIYFKPETIDGRFPSLDDGKSWLTLLSNYQIIDEKYNFAVLTRKSTLTSPSMQLDNTPVIHYALGEEIPLPASDSPVWAEITAKPTIMGRIINTIYKMPDTAIVARSKTGATSKYKFIPQMGESGFLISPIIETTGEFVSLLSSHRSILLNSQTVTSFHLAARETKSQNLWRWLWQPEVSVRLRPFNPPSQPEADNLLFDPWLSVVPSAMNNNMEILGQCVFDVVNSKPVTAQPISLDQPFLEVSGWAAISTSDGIAPDDIFLILTDEDGKMHVAKVKKAPRPDVNSYFHQPEMGDVGFSAMLELPVLPKSALLRVAQSHNGQIRICPSVVKLNLGSP